jgi:hypothetical protein
LSRRVKGTLFVDYVRMIRSQKSVDWSKHLSRDDLVHLKHRVLPDAWYPMETFERMGLAILTETHPELDTIKLWGRTQIDWLSHVHSDLVVRGDAVDTLMRFKVLRASFFDFEAIEIVQISEGEAVIEISYGMSDPAEEAASHQTLGFFERLLECTGASDVEAWFSCKAWEGHLKTTLQLRWTPGLAS